MLTELATTMDGFVSAQTIADRIFLCGHNGVGGVVVTAARVGSQVRLVPSISAFCLVCTQKLQACLRLDVCGCNL